MIEQSFNPQPRAARFLPRTIISARTLPTLRLLTKLTGSTQRPDAQVVSVDTDVSVHVFRPASARPRTPVTGTGAAGPIRLVAGGLPNIDNVSFLTSRSDVVFVAQNGSSSRNGPDRIGVVYPNGTYKAVLTAADGLASPSATAVRGDRLYITNGGVPEPHDAKLQIGRINFVALLANAAQ